MKTGKRINAVTYTTMPGQDGLPDVRADVATPPSSIPMWSILGA
jgi:hypothetical protein